MGAPPHCALAAIAVLAIVVVAVAVALRRPGAAGLGQRRAVAALAAGGLAALAVGGLGGRGGAALRAPAIRGGGALAPGAQGARAPNPCGGRPAAVRAAAGAAAEADTSSTPLGALGAAPPEPATYRARFHDRNTVGPGGPSPAPASLPPRPHLLAYNVHTFRDIEGHPTLDAVGGLLRAYAPAVETVVLAEVALEPTALKAFLGAAGYPHSVTAPNGVADDSLRIVVASREPLRDAAVVATDVGEGAPGAGPAGRALPGFRHRKQVEFTTRSGLRGVAVHLEIGTRLGRRPEYAAVDAARRAQNSAVRCEQLAVVLGCRPDFLVGDFNFTLADPERSFLEERGYCPVNDGASDSTPYNRVDHVFVRRELLGRFPPESNALVRCNYSDHLPMLQAL